MVFILACLFLAPAYSNAVQKKNVLVLNSYHPGFSWTDSILKGIRSVLKPKNGIELFVEYMDTKRHDTEDYFQRLKALYEIKYMKKKIDVILSSDDHALDFLLKYRNELFPGVPVVFCGVDRVEPERLAGHDRIFGVEEGLEFEKNIRMALRLHPEVESIAIVGDFTKSSLSYLGKIKKIEAKLSGQVRFDYLTNLTVKELQNAIKQLPYNSFIMYLILTRDRNGLVLSLEEGLSLIGKNSHVPVYIAWETPLGPNVMGGDIASAFKQGATSASLVKRILAGEPLESLPKLQVGPHVRLFNYPVMRRYGLKKTDLPKDSIIVNEPYSFYREHRTLVWNVMAAFMGLVLIVVLLSVNILSRKRAEKELLASETRLKSLLETANEGFWEIDNDSRVVDLNPEMCKIVGRKRENILGRAAYNFLDEPNQEIFQKEMTIRKKGIRSSYELQFTHPDGKNIHCLVNASPLFGEYQGKIGSFAMITDISERKRVEEQLITSKRVLAQSESMYRAISEFADFGIMLLGQKEIIYSNQRLADFMDIKAGSISKSDLFAWICDEDLADFKRSLGNLLKGAYEGPVRFEFRGRNSSGLRDYLAHAQLMDYSENTVVHMFLEDITEQKEMTRRARLNELRMYHEDRLSALGVMATGIAHELNQPLNTIRVLTDGFLFGRDEGWDLDTQEVFDHLEMISRQVVRMSQIIQNIRNFAREDRVRDANEIDPNKAIEDVFSMLGTQLEVHGIRVEKFIEAKVPKIRANLNRLEQVIMNLLVNARQALDGCEKERKIIWLKTGARYDQVFIEVGDNATGIPEKEMSKIFDPFYSTKEVGKGTGLGLSISKTIVSEFRGRLEAYNNKEGGATFFITVPCSHEIQ